MVERLERMADQRKPMNMLFYGQPGVGKTSAARILLNKLDADYCEINGSMETGIEQRSQEHRDVLRLDVDVQCGEGLLHRRV